MCICVCMAIFELIFVNGLCYLKYTFSLFTGFNISVRFTFYLDLSYLFIYYLTKNINRSPSLAVPFHFSFNHLYFYRMNINGNFLMCKYP